MNSGTPLDQHSLTDPNALSRVSFDPNDAGIADTVGKFESQNYSVVMNFRAQTTLEALRTIAHYVSGYPGRKNLIWVSGSFPGDVTPTLDTSASQTTGTDSNPNSTMGGGDNSSGGTTGGNDSNSASSAPDNFSGTRSYREEILDPANGLTDAHVAVYPVDARGLETELVYAAARETDPTPDSPKQVGARLEREDVALTQSHETMDKVAEATGGKTCTNTNDLSGCIETALKDSSSYYELAYNPQNAKWDGSFHTISVKTTRPGVKLAYRRGYYAQDAEALAKEEPPEKRLQQACQDYLPSTAIPITAQSVPSEKPDEIRYMLSVPPGALSLAPDGPSHKLSAEMATCVYSANGGAFRFTTTDLSRPLSDADFSTLQTSGLQYYLGAPKSGTERVRIALLDLGTGLTGALDIAVHPEDFESAAAPPAQPETSPAASASAAPAPAVENPPSQPAPAYTITFHSSSGAASALDWSGDTLSFHGDAATAQQFAPAFFHHVIDPKFRCQDGQLVPRDAGDATPNLHFSFKNPAGQTAIVDLTGSEPQYSGDLPVDPSAKPFFEALWNLCHCGAAPHLLSVPLQRAGGGSILRAETLRDF
jgi:VWFA-related protein